MIKNPVAFIGQAVLGATAGAPLSADSNGLLASGITVTQVTATTGTSTSSGTFSVISTMTITPTVSGVYLATFSGSVAIGGNDSGQLAIFVNAVQQTHTTRTVTISASGLLGATAQGEWAANSEGVLTLTSGQAIDVRFRATSGTITANQRSFKIQRIS